MPVKKKTKPQTLLIESIVEAITDKKGKEPVILNFAKLSGTVCDAFIICHGSSRTHTEALARNVDEVVKKNTGQDPWHKEGFENAEWILIDYGDIVVHIFQEERRKFYNIEQLWADAEITKVDVTE
jgi:ribosome-associated protein